jgi:hypothetical protein
MMPHSLDGACSADGSPVFWERIGERVFRHGRRPEEPDENGKQRAALIILPAADCPFGSSRARFTGEHRRRSRWSPRATPPCGCSLHILEARCCISRYRRPVRAQIEMGSAARAARNLEHCSLSVGRVSQCGAEPLRKSSNGTLEWTWQ